MSELGDPSDGRILVVAPVGADARNLEAAFGKAGLPAEACRGLVDAAAKAQEGCGAIVLTEEALTDRGYSALAHAFGAQPAWSRIPVVVIVAGGRDPSFEEKIAEILGRRSDLSLVERPVRTATLVSAVRSALGSRRHQYHVRDLLREREEILASLERKVDERTAHLQSLNEELEAFSYSISHDLKAPLRSIEGFAHSLEDDHGGELSPTARVHVSRIKKNAARMAELLRDVLAVARVGHQGLDINRVDLDALVEEVIAQNPQLQSARSSIEIIAPLGQVMANETMLLQVISNLMLNALKFVPNDRTPEVKMWTARNDSNLQLNIRDNGVGIEPRNHERVFQLFERAVSAQIPGTGVGLTIVKRAMDRMGGRVGVDSERGQGARFWIQLPAG